MAISLSLSLWMCECVCLCVSVSACVLFNALYNGAIQLYRIVFTAKWIADLPAAYYRVSLNQIFQFKPFDCFDYTLEY